MTHIDFNMGVWYPKGGMYEIPKAMTAIGKELGVTFHTSCPTKEITIDPRTNQATGVVFEDGSQADADMVISNADYYFTESNLLPKEYRQYTEKSWDKKVQSPSAYIMYLGIDKKLDKLSHHTLIFAKDWDKHFSEVFDKPNWPEDPSIYIGTASRTDDDIAPPGMENVFILVPIASELDDSPSQRETYREVVMGILEKNVDPTIRDHIKVERIFTQRDFKDIYNSHKGSALGLAHTLWQTALFRPRNQSKKVGNLFYTGANTVPGIGVPMCLISAELTLERMMNYEKRG